MKNETGKFFQERAEIVKKYRGYFKRLLKAGDLLERKSNLGFSRLKMFIQFKLNRCWKPLKNKRRKTDGSRWKRCAIPEYCSMTKCQSHESKKNH